MNKITIVDGHLHLGCDPYNFVPKKDIQQLLLCMKIYGIKRAYSCHYKWLLCRFKEGYESSISAYQESGGKIPYFGVYVPTDIQASLKYLDKSLKSGGLIGIKIHPSFHKTYADDPKYLPVWNYAKEYHLPILSHTWSLTDNPEQKFSLPPLFTKYLENYQEVFFVMGHSGGRGNGRSEVVELAKRFRNVYLDIAGDIFCYNLIPELVGSVGVEKIIFGTDWPWFDPASYLPRIILSSVTDEQKKKILGLNALKVYEPNLF
jgi:predicted TIM-barrel fold metal-dependent hydrolase